MNTNIVNFFDLSTNNNEPLRTDEEFGLCDDDNSQPAYSNDDVSKKETNWVAIVDNPQNLPVRFFALDYRIPTPPKQRICDGMLQVNEFEALHLVELKVRYKRWASDARQQVEATINFMKQFHEHELQQFQRKYAHTCNKRFPDFNKSSITEREEFYRKTGFILKTKRTIKLSEENDE